ncbi:MAG: hypothetical protein WCJ95_23260, partial [Mariniphaga sp.]
MRGRAEAINGNGNLLITYEHPTTVNFVRNEFLRKDGNRSVFIAKNTNDAPIYFHEEIFANYDVMCVSGKISPELYLLKRARCPAIIAVGSYDA